MGGTALGEARLSLMPGGRANSRAPRRLHEHAGCAAHGAGRAPPPPAAPSGYLLGGRADLRLNSRSTIYKSTFSDMGLGGLGP